MVFKWLLTIIVSSILWASCLSNHECITTMNSTSQIVFKCLPNVVINELPLYGYTVAELANITSIVVKSLNDSTPGPFTSIPPNICLLRNLMTIDFSNNLITQVDPANAISTCLSNVITFDISYNSISDFPSVLIYNMPILKYLYFQHNRLTNVPANAFYNVSNLERIDFSYNFLTNLELWTLFVRQSVDFSNNRISMITNTAFNTISQYELLGSTINLSNNSATINLTDAVYEMYDSCSEVYYWLNSSTQPELLTKPLLTSALGYLNFGTTKINCSCDQSYFVSMILATFGGVSVETTSNIPMYRAQCTDGRLFIESGCSFNSDLPNSSIDFSQVYPRQCKIYQHEYGNLTTKSNISIPLTNTSTYPHYEQRLMTPGACSFSFFNTTSMRIRCTNDTSNSSVIPSDLLSSNYFSNITRVDFGSAISSLPSYMCSLPSRNIDLSFQRFTNLSDETFPCLNVFRSVILNNNQLTYVNMKSGNFTTLTSLDLSSNRLTEIPHTILIPNPSSLSYLDLANNSISSIDIFLYSLKDITINIRNNPINSSNIINPLNVTLSRQNNTNSTSVITFPSTVTNSTYIFNDQTALTAGACNRYSVLAYKNTLESMYSNIFLDCTCASINLKQIFLRNQSNILDDFNCSNQTLVQSFNLLTMSNCSSTSLDFGTGLCWNESLQITLDNITARSLSSIIQLTSTAITLLKRNLSSSLTILTKSQDYTDSPDFEGSSSNVYTFIITNTSNRLSNLYTETIKPKDSSYSEVTVVSSTNSSHQINIASEINATTVSNDATTALPTILSLSSTLLIADTSETLEDSNVTTSTDWTTSTTTSTTSSTSATTTTLSTSTTTTITSTSTTTTITSTSATTTTSSTSTTTTITSTSTTTTTSSTSTTTTTSSTSTTTTSTRAAVVLSSNDSDTSRNSLILGLVLGLVGCFALAAGIVAATVIKVRAANNIKTNNKPVYRAAVVSSTPQHANLKSNIQTRNSRRVLLPPINSQPSQLSPSSLATTEYEKNTAPTSFTTSNRSDLRSSSRVVPLQTD